MEGARDVCDRGEAEEAPQAAPFSADLKAKAVTLALEEGKPVAEVDPQRTFVPRVNSRAAQARRAADGPVSSDRGVMGS